MMVLQLMDTRSIRGAEDFAIQSGTTTQPVEHSDSVHSKTQKPKTQMQGKYCTKMKTEGVLKQILIILSAHALADLKVCIPSH